MGYVYCGILNSFLSPKKHNSKSSLDPSTHIEIVLIIILFTKPLRMLHCNIILGIHDAVFHFFMQMQCCDVQCYDREYVTTCIRRERVILL